MSEAEADLFSTAGLLAWRRRLEASPDFHRAAADWTGTLLLRETDTDRRAVFVALEQGDVSACRVATDDDAAAAEFVLEAAHATWHRLVRGEADLTRTALAGDLRLIRGSLFRLLPHVAAATALLRSAGPGD